MRTDEYEISMGREIDVCIRMINGLKETLAIMEKKHGKSSSLFIKDLADGIETAGVDDCTEWKENYNAMKRWEEKLTQYKEFYGSDKIDS